MGKRILDHKLRLRLRTALLVIITADLLLLLVFGIIGVQTSKEITLHTYSTKSELKYDVTLVDDPLYNNDLLELGTVYIMKYISNLNLKLVFNLDSDAVKDMHGFYTASAVMESKYNNAKILWKKEYPLITQTPFDSKSIDGNYVLNLGQYRDFVMGLDSSLNISASTTMLITYTVNWSAVINGVPVDGTSASTLSFDLKEDVISMGGEPISEQTKELIHTISQDLIPKSTVLVTTIPILAVLAAMLCYLLKLTVGVRPDPVEVEIKKICKRYGGRIIELGVIPTDSVYETIQTKTFLDLLLIADEVKKPIFKNSTEIIGDTEFHVIDGNQKYMYQPKKYKTEKSVSG